MPSEVRGATRTEYPAIAEVILRAFKDDELDLWQYLVANDPSLEPEGVRVSVAGGRIVACTVVLPRSVMTRAGWTPGAVVTLVACDPEYERQGHGGATVRSALEYCRARGLALGLLYGIPDFYPRFGFVPVLPWLWTEVDAANIAGGPYQALGELEPALSADLPILNELFERGPATYPMAVRRGADEWVWRQRNSSGKAMVVVRGRDGRPVAYARTYTDARYPGVAIVPEAVVEQPCDAVGLVSALAARAAEQGFERLRLVLPPRETLVRAALLLGAEQRYRPATSGMAAVTDWAMVLPEGYSVADYAGEPNLLLLSYQGSPMLAAPRRLLAQLALGYRGADDLALLPEASLLGTCGENEGLRRDFPALYPRWTEAPCW